MLQMQAPCETAVSSTRAAPLATPEQDCSLQEGVPSSLENLSGVLDALDSDEDGPAVADELSACDFDRANSEPANLEFDARGDLASAEEDSPSPAPGGSHNGSPLPSSLGDSSGDASSSQTLSASEEEDGAETNNLEANAEPCERRRRQTQPAQRCHSDSECSFPRPRRQHNRHSHHQAHQRRRAPDPRLGVPPHPSAGLVPLPYSHSDHGSLALEPDEALLGPRGHTLVLQHPSRRMLPPEDYDRSCLLPGDGMILASVASNRTSTVEPSTTASSVGPVTSMQQPQHNTTTRLPSIPERTIRYQRVQLEEPLPPHWEARIDSHGRIDRKSVV